MPVKIFFHHLAKVGGGSVRAFLDSCLRRGLIHDLRYGGHEALRDEVVASITREGFFKVLFLRDPIDRFVSAYNFYVTHEESVHIPAKDRSWMSVRGDLLRTTYGQDINRMIEEQRRDGFAWLFDRARFPHFTPIKDQYKAIAFYDFVGRTETLAHDLERLAEAIGVNRSGLTYDFRANVSPRLVTRADITPDHIQLLKALFAREYQDLA